MIKNDWTGYFICPNCKRIHSVWEVKTEVITLPFKNNNLPPTLYNQNVEHLCCYCNELIYGYHVGEGMYSKFTKIREVIFLTNGKLVFISKKEE